MKALFCSRERNRNGIYNAGLAKNFLEQKKRERQYMNTRTQSWQTVWLTRLEGGRGGGGEGKKATKKVLQNDGVKLKMVSGVLGHFIA